MSDKVIDFQAARLARQRAGAQQIEAPAGGFKDRVGAPVHAETHSVYGRLPITSIAGMSTAQLAAERYCSLRVRLPCLPLCSAP